MLYSQRKGISRAYSQNQLYDVLTCEFKKWSTYQLFLRALGGNIYFGDDDDEYEEAKSFKLDGDIEEPDVFFRRALIHDMSFNFRDASYFFHHLPIALSPMVSGTLNLFFDFIELIYPLAATVNLNIKTGKLNFNKREGQKLFRDAINPDLALFETPLQLLSNGQIVEISNRPVLELINESLELVDTEGLPDHTVAPIQNAVGNYVKRGASTKEKKEAVRDLADSLESLRASVKKNLLTADEKELFQIANNFAIRHNTSKQKSDYNEEIWYDWMFHVNLAALLTVIKILKVQSDEAQDI